MTQQNFSTQKVIRKSSFWDDDSYENEWDDTVETRPKKSLKQTKPSFQRERSYNQRSSNRNNDRNERGSTTNRQNDNYSRNDDTYRRRRDGDSYGRRRDGDSYGTDSGSYGRRRNDDSYSRRRDGDSYGRDRNDYGKGNKFVDNENRINLKLLEESGFVHLYGISSVLNALAANRRDFTPSSLEEKDTKPEAQLTPHLFVQESKHSTRKSDKAASANKIMSLARERNIPIVTVDKGVLNTLCQNRPHQGFVLRCGKLEFESISRIPFLQESRDDFWLVLDEIVDPQNFGALLRSAYFFGQRVNVVTCSKNSAPPSPVVSAASAGALELMHERIYETSNLPRLLQNANLDGWRVLGAAPFDNDVTNAKHLQDVSGVVPTILVLGSEGHGLRNLVAKSCTEFIRIPSSITDNGLIGVDSLNVSVTGGIMLWHFLNGRNEQS